MRTQFLLAQADDCRRHADDLDGQPEAPILLRIAGYFECLAAQSPNRRDESLCVELNDRVPENADAAGGAFMLSPS